MKKIIILGIYKKCLLFIFSGAFLYGMISIFQPFRLKLFTGIVFLTIIVYFCIKSNTLIKFRIKDKPSTIMALLSESIVFVYFYQNMVHVKPNAFMRILFLLPESVSCFSDFWMFVAGVLLCIIGFYFAKVVSFSVVGQIKIFYEVFKEHKAKLILLLSVLLISFIPIMRANYYYTDDLGRTVYGYEMTGSFSRYIADFLSVLFHGNSWLSDIAPLTQIAALGIMAFAGIILLQAVSEFFEVKVYTVIGLIPLCLSPYFLNNLSYRYDAPYMAISVLASILPIVYFKHNLIKYGIAVCVGTIIMCTTYQVSSGIFPMITGFVFLLMWLNRYKAKELVKFLLSSVAGYSSGLLLFRFVIMESLSDADVYVDTGISIQKVLPNLKNYCTLFNNDFSFFWKGLIILIGLSFVVFAVKKSKQNKVLTVLVMRNITQ